MKIIGKKSHIYDTTLIKEIKSIKKDSVHSNFLITQSKLTTTIYNIQYDFNQYYNHNIVGEQKKHCYLKCKI